MTSLQKLEQKIGEALGLEKAAQLTLSYNKKTQTVGGHILSYGYEKPYPIGKI